MALKCVFAVVLLPVSLQVMGNVQKQDSHKLTLASLGTRKSLLPEGYSKFCK